MNVTNSLSGSIQVTRDSNQSQAMDTDVSTSFDSNVAVGVIALSLAAGNNSIQLPATLCYQLYVKNTDQSKWVQVLLTTPQSGLVGGGTGKVIVQTLYPGDEFIMWQNPSSKNTSAGFSTLDLFAQDPNTLCEYFVGA